jgi:hypothetical protein
MRFIILPPWFYILKDIEGRRKRNSHQFLISISALLRARLSVPRRNQPLTVAALQNKK